MTVEQAIYYKYLLICGYSYELNKYIDDCLNDENSISDIILNLSDCGSDNKKLLTVLNNFVLEVPQEQINYDKVFNLVLNFLRTQYFEEKAPIEKVTDLMHKISNLTEKDLNNPWWTMNTLSVLYAEAKVGYITMESFMDVFEKFINAGICIDPSGMKISQKGHSLFKRILSNSKRKY